MCPTATLRSPGDAQGTRPDYSLSIQPARASEPNQGYNWQVRQVRHFLMNFNTEVANQQNQTELNQIKLTYNPKEIGRP
jgi:hypothetical protein